MSDQPLITPSAALPGFIIRDISESAANPALPAGFRARIAFPCCPRQKRSSIGTSDGSRQPNQWRSQRKAGCPEVRRLRVASHETASTPARVQRNGLAAWTAYRVSCSKHGLLTCRPGHSGTHRSCGKDGAAADAKSSCRHSAWPITREAFESQPALSDYMKWGVRHAV